MARPTLINHRKFRRLCALTGLDEPTILGHLEFLWMSAYESGDDFVGDSVDVELAARWKGEPGVLTKALLECGGDGMGGFIDAVNGSQFIIHDLWDHAPEYVQKRLKRELERRERGEARKRQYVSRERPLTAEWRAKEDLGNLNKDIGNFRQNKAELGTPPAPAPAPAPAPTQKSSATKPKTVSSPKLKYFEQFYLEYPNHSEKPLARGVWIKKNLGEKGEMILESLKKWKKSKHWQDGYIKGIVKWLEGECWNDEIPRGAVKSEALAKKEREDAERQKERVDKFRANREAAQAGKMNGK